jgi:hypothetical protein
LERLEILYIVSISLVHVHIIRTGGSNIFCTSYGGSKRGGGCEIAYAYFSLMADQKDLKLLGMLYCHLEVCILSGQDDPILFLEVMMDPRRTESVK